LSEILSTYGKRVKELAKETAATSKRPYGRINETLCDTPTIGFDKVPLEIQRKFEELRNSGKQLNIVNNFE
jgi:hypothetical protein